MRGSLPPVVRSQKTFFSMDGVFTTPCGDTGAFHGAIVGATSVIGTKKWDLPTELSTCYRQAFGRLSLQATTGECGGSNLPVA
jgi:hypothetical protein